MNKEDFLIKFNKYASKSNISLDTEKIEKLYDYMKLVLDWNNKVNLTSIIDEDEFIIKHFIDCLYLSDKCGNGLKVIDVGTGAGFPGIPLKIANDKLEITLVDSLNKRINFLSEVVNKIDLKNVSLIHSRAEDLAIKKEYREQFDVAVSRAVAPLNVLLEYLVPFVRVGGKIIAMKGENSEEEIRCASNAIEKLKVKIEKIEAFELPNQSGKRNILIIKKLEKTPNDYPRKAGIPKRKPL